MESDPAIQQRPARSSTETPSSLAGADMQALRALRLVGDAVVVVLALALSFVLRFELELLSLTDTETEVLNHHLLASGVWFAALLVFLAMNRLYDEDTLFVGGGESARVVHSVVQAIAVLAIFVFLTQSFAISRSWFLFTVVGTAASLVTWRAGVRAIVRLRRARGSWRRPAVVVGDPVGEDEDSSLLHDDHEFQLVGRISPAALLDHHTLGTQPPIPLRRGTVLLVRAPGLREDDLWRIVMIAGDIGCTTFIHAATRSASRDRLSVREVGGKTIVKVSPPNLSGLKALQKRFLDLVLGTTLLVVLSPVLVGIAIAIAASSGRPIFFRQERVGLDGRTFMMIKFRSMRTDAESDRPGWTTPQDERRTAIGAVLRRFSLDELPQLWNVLVGHMSLVGPRPEVPTFVQEFNRDLPWYRYRHRIRPGMTGLAQSRGLRGDTSIASRIELDNRYIEHWSLGLDLRILFLTIREVVSSRNAY